MNGALWAWVLEKAWKIDLNVLHRKEFDRHWCTVENDARLNSKPAKRFQKWNGMGKPRRPCDIPR